MSKKIAVIMIAAVIAVCLITGVAFAVWSVMDKDHVFRFSASDLELNISSDQLQVDNKKLTPYEPINASFVIEVVGEKSTVSFTLSSLTYNGGDNGEFISVPEGVVEVVLPQRIYGIGGESIKNAKCDVVLRFASDIAAADIDPFYMNKEFKFIITAKAVKYVTPTQYSITYHNVESDIVNDNITTYSVETNYTFKDLVREGYEFQGWYLDSDFNNRITELRQDTPVNNINLFAKWSAPIEYTIDYIDPFSITHVNPINYNIETETFVLTELVKDGYQFLGWYDQEADENRITEIVKGSHGNKTLYARWSEPIAYVIQYNDKINADNSANAHTSYTVISPTITLAPLAKDGYKFLGWFNQESGGEQITEIITGSIGDKVLYAQWETVKYAIIYNNIIDADNTANASEYDITSSITFNDITRQGYVFLGWFDTLTGGNKITGIEIGNTGDKTVYAQWQINTYSINYNGLNGADNSENATEYTIESQTIALKDIALDGHNFLGFYDAETDGNRITEIASGSTGDITLYARWEIIRYTITYEGVEDADNRYHPTTYTINDRVVFSVIIRPGYDLIGWFDAPTGGNQITEIPKGSTGNITIYAQWRALA